MASRLLERVEEGLRSAVARRVVLPAHGARRRHPFELAGEVPEQSAELLARAAGALASAQHGLRLAAQALSPRGRKVPLEVLAELAEAARRGGASAVGCAEVTPDLVFAGGGVPAPHALVLLLPMDKAAVRTAPSHLCLRTVNQTYADLGALVDRLTLLLRERGFAAFPGPPLGGEVDYPSLAERAGLGVLAASGLLVSRGSGPCQRVGAVYLELERRPAPAAPGLDWVPDYCRRCQSCVRECPAGAIRARPPTSGDGHVACVDGDRCLDYFRSHWGCSVCIKVCPLIRGELSRPPRVRRAAR